MDKITQRLFGLAAVIAAFAFLLHTASPAIADAPQQSYSTGKYQSSVSYTQSSSGGMVVAVYITNPETGAGIMYHWQTGGSFDRLGNFSNPANPI